MRVIRDDIWLCADCLMLAVNGDASGIDDPAREAACNAGLERLGPHLAPSWINDEETGEITDGYLEFSWHGCDCCHSRLGGDLHRFAILGEGVSE